FVDRYLAIRIFIHRAAPGIVVGCPRGLDPFTKYNSNGYCAIFKYGKWITGQLAEEISRA
ncbi:MAG: hypothetical protein ABI813_05415, partial [Bacteroidota bacterium]